MPKKNPAFEFIVRLHRWQPHANRYRVQKLSLSSSETSAEVITDILFRRAMFEHDATVNQIIARTQQVDRVMINALDGTVDIWMSPTVERVYNKTGIARPGRASGFRKPTAADRLCDCYHAQADHALLTTANGNTHGICLVPGCGCKAYIPLETIERMTEGNCAQCAKAQCEIGCSCPCHNKLGATVDRLLDVFNSRITKKWKQRTNRKQNAECPIAASPRS